MISVQESEHLLLYLKSGGVGDGGMRGGITSERMRSQVITLHIDKEPFNKHLDITDEKIVYVYVLDPEGKILYKDQGRFSQEKWLELEKFLEKK